MKKFLGGLAVVGMMSLALAGCSTTGDSAGGGDELITVGFAQTGSESGWRSANTESMKAAFSEENGFKLVFFFKFYLIIAIAPMPDPFWFR